MARDIANSDVEFIAEARKYSVAARKKAADYGTTLAELDAFDLEINDLETEQDAEDAAYTAYRAQVKATAAKRLPAEKTFRGLRADTYAHATEEEQIEAGLEPRKKPVQTDPTPPQNLRAEGGLTGIIALAYEAGENPEGTEYVLYETDSLQNPWVMWDVVSTLRAKQTGQTVNKPKYFMVRARRRGILSEPSNVAVAFG